MISRFAPSAKHKAQTEAFGLRIAWPVVQSVCVPKISPLGGPVSEILADVTFVTDARTDGRTHIHINSENYIYRLLCKMYMTMQKILEPRIELLIPEGDNSS